jgi:murein DD-endopeptidase MepM/ murein hydrolase activator NlpD
LLNASVGVQRVMSRLRPAPSQRSSMAVTIQRRSLEAARAIRALVVRPREDVREARIGTRPADPQDAASARQAGAPLNARTVSSTRLTVRPRAADASGPLGGRIHLTARSAAAETTIPLTARAVARRSLISRIGTERAVPAVAIAILLVATAISSAPALSPSGPVGGPFGDGPEARLAAGGAAGGPQGAVEGDTSGDGDVVIGDEGSIGDYGTIGAGAAPGEGASGDEGTPPSDTTDPEAAVSRDAGFLDDGTILKPVAVDTTVSDGKGLMRTYRVRSGDTLTGIARKFDVSMMTVWWANHLTAKDDLHVGQFLTIPPVSGVVVTVGGTDTLETLAAKYGVEPSEIVEVNELDDPHLVIGQTLTVPGALGKAIATPKPKPTTKPSSGGSRNNGGGSSVKPPARYTGGKFAWPVAGGYISQYYHYGHYAIDIAADSGTSVKAAAAGSVLFAGWKSNGGGYQIWVSHGSGLYTTYNHLSSVAVGRGQHVSRGQHIGRVGSSGNATGPHLHFEVWKGPIWNGGSRVNPLSYL